MSGRKHRQTSVARLVVDDAGRSALDVAKDPTSRPEDLRSMVQREVDMMPKLWNDRRQYDWSLSKAAEEGDLSAVRRLVEAGANVNIRASTLERPRAITAATLKGHVHVVHCLLEIEKNRVSSTGYSAQRLRDALPIMDPEEISRLYTEREVEKLAFENKMFALAAAASIGNVELAQILINHGATINVYQNEREGPRWDDPLQEAAGNGHHEMTKFLLQQGAAVKPKDISRGSALRKASASGFEKVVEELLRAGAVPDDDDALHEAAFNGHLAVVRQLLQAGATVDSLKKRRGGIMEVLSTALQEAARGGRSGIVEALLEAGADANAAASYPAMKALQAAAHAGSISAVELLIAAGADVNGIVEDTRMGRSELEFRKPYTALQAAAKRGHADIVERLLEAGAALEDEDIAEGQKPAVMFAIEKGHIAIAERLLREDRPSLPRGRRSTMALHAAAHGGHETIVQHLLARGTTPSELTDRIELVPKAAAKGYTSIVKMLIDAGAIWNRSTLRSYLDQTALQLAVSKGHLDTAQLLLSYGANTEVALGRSRLPLAMACLFGDADMVRILLDAGADPKSIPKSESEFRQFESDRKSGVIAFLRARGVAIEKIYEDDGEREAPRVPMKGLCPTCSSLPLDVFLGARRDREDTCFHKSLKAMRRYAREGCPFCIFLWRRLDIEHVEKWLNYPLLLCGNYWVKGKDFDEEDWFSIRTDDYWDPGPSADFHITVEPFEGKRKPLPGDTGSSATFRQVLSWLNDCDKNHGSCKITTGEHGFLPTRLIHIVRWDERKELRLVESRTLANQSPPYVTLSHRWDQSATMSASTTQENFHQRLRFLDSDCLPQSFLDAITVTHRIGVRYLWIDSLCILQGSKNDWDHESSLMGDIYSNAYCTIAADVTTNSASGMFRAKESDERDFIKFSVASDDGKPKMVQAFKREPLWDSTLSSGILHKRGWCLQERELSSRIIHYTEKQVLWECRTLRASEGWPNRHVTKVKDVVQKITDQMEESDNSAIYDLWHTAVRGYSSRRLTHGEDTLPALAGLARIVSERTNSDYVAGIWVDDIRRSLAWYAGLDFTKHPSYVAPSWSWASGSGGIRFVYDKGHYETSAGHSWASFGKPDYTPKKNTAVITGHNIRLRTSDPFSRIHSAELYVTAPVLDGIVRPDTKESSDEVPRLWIPLETKICGIVNFDVRADASSTKVVRVICLSLVVSDKGVGIAMVPVEGRECTYRRVGCVQNLDIVPFRSLKAESFTIV